MLEELLIRNFAIIDKLAIRFESGLNLLTGETGAGKSILIGALGFILGNKADTGIIRTGSEECLVTAVFNVIGNAQAENWLQEHDIEVEDGTVIVRRSLKKTGRGSIYIQNTVFVRSDLQEFASSLVEIHGQKDGHALLKKEKQRSLLDRYAGLDLELEAFYEIYQKLGAKRKALETMTSSETERAREAEFLRFAIDEIEQAALKQNEDAELELEERRLSEYEKLFELVSNGKSILSDSEGVVSKLKKAKAALEGSSAIDNRLLDASRRLGDAFYELSDVSSFLSSYCDKLLFDPVRMEEIENRLALIQKLKRKYGDSLEAVIKHKTDSQNRLLELENWEEDRAGLEIELSELEKTAFSKASDISKIRIQAALKLDNFVCSVLSSLGMANAVFKTRIIHIPLENGKVVLDAHGMDDVEFYISANKGEPLRPLSDVASGGELSRVMLALKTAFAESSLHEGQGSGDQSLVFDEIDTGIGGEVALAVGLHLAKLAENKQVLCITHLASIASRADNHYMVEKSIEDGRTVTNVYLLSMEARIKEIARMLSGDADSKTSLDHAKELIERFGRTRGQNG